MQKYQLVVVGAGPAGLLAAAKAAQEGLSVLLLEKMEKPARKLRITGKGRCNITNTKPEVELMKRIFPQSRFFRSAFRNLSNLQLVKLLNDAGLETVEERGDRVFPASQKAWDVADTLVKLATQSGVEILCNAKVGKLIVVGDEVKALQLTINGEPAQVTADAVIVATGGLSYPTTGSTGDGYHWAEELGVEVTPTRPSLVELHVKEMDSRLAGLSLRNVSLELWVDGGCKDDEFGELLFTPDGVDGPVVLRLSREAVDSLTKNKRVQLKLDLKPALSKEQLLLRIQRELEATPRPATVEALLRKLLPAELVLPFAEKAKVATRQKTVGLGRVGKERIVDTLKCFEMEVGGHGDYTRAVVTAGGIALDELDAKTMRVKKYRNLFFAGEVVDLDGDTGGYNLQIAFSTGYLAGLSAARLLCRES